MQSLLLTNTTNPDMPIKTNKKQKRKPTNFMTRRILIFFVQLPSGNLISFIKLFILLFS